MVADTRGVTARERALWQHVGVRMERALWRRVRAAAVAADEAAQAGVVRALVRALDDGTTTAVRASGHAAPAPRLATRGTPRPQAARPGQHGRIAAPPSSPNVTDPCTACSHSRIVHAEESGRCGHARGCLCRGYIAAGRAANNGG